MKNLCVEMIPFNEINLGSEFECNEKDDMHRLSYFDLHIHFPPSNDLFVYKVLRYIR